MRNKILSWQICIRDELLKIMLVGIVLTAVERNTCFAIDVPNVEQIGLKYKSGIYSGASILQIWEENMGCTIVPKFRNKAGILSQVLYSNSENDSFFNSFNSKNEVTNEDNGNIKNVKRTFAGISAGVKGGIGVSETQHSSDVGLEYNVYLEARIFRRIGIEISYWYWYYNFISMKIRIYNFDNYPFLLAGGLGIDTYYIPSLSLMIKYVTNSGIELLGESCLSIGNVMESTIAVRLYVGIGFSYPQIKK